MSDDDQSRLDRSFAGGLAWSGTATAVTQILGWTVTLVVARILTPTDYGIIGMAAAYTILAQMVSEGGLSAAIVQAPRIRREQVSATAGLSVILGIAVFAVSVALAGPVAAFFGEPRVRPVVAVLSLSFVLAGFRVVPEALLSRDLAFRQIALIDTVEAVVAATATLLLALLGSGYWALAIGPVTGKLVSTIFANISRPHPVASPFPLGHVRGVAGFGFSVLLSRVAWYLYSNADFAIVGRILGPAPLGVYTIGWNIAAVPLNKVSALYQKATGPVFAAAQGSPEALRRYLFRLTEAIALVAFPASLGLALVAPDLVAAVLGEKWQLASAPLAILAAAAAIRSLDPVLAQILIWTGRPTENTRVMLTAAVLMPLLFWAGTRWGVNGVAAAWVIGYPVVVFVPLLARVLALLETRLTDYLRCLMPAAVPTAAMVLVVFAVSRAASGLSAPQRLIVLPATGLLVFVLVLLAAYRHRIVAARAFLRSVIGRKSALTSESEGVGNRH